MGCIVLNGHVGFDLADHVAGEVQAAEGFALSAKGEDDGGGELVVCGAGAVLGVEYVDAIPAAGAGG